MDPIAFLISLLPEPWGLGAAFLVLAASIGDVVLPAVDPPSRWVIPRTALHILALNRQGAMAQIARWRGRAAP